jgi:hypothetical protein
MADNASITMDIFNGSGFTNASLTGWVNVNVPFVPGLIGSLPMMFKAQPVYTTSVEFDDENGSLTLIPATPRGSAPTGGGVAPKGTLRMLKTVRLAREAAIYADTVSNVRVLGGASQLKTAQDLVYSRIEGPFGKKAELSMTLEHMYLGAIDGVVLDADNATTIWDYFAFYGVSRPAAVNTNFSTLMAEAAAFATQITKAKRVAIKALNGLLLGGAIPIVLCGDDYYDAAWGSAELTYARAKGATGSPNAMQEISKSTPYGSFIYNETLFINYRGTDDGSTVSIPTAEGRLFYANVPGLFPTFFAPADTWDFVNTQGLPSYLIQRRERQTESCRVFEIQSNPLTMNMRPKHVQRLVKTG